MLQKCLSYAKALYISKEQQDIADKQSPEGANILAWGGENPSKPIPRYLQLARSIHARFTAEEEKKMAVYKAAEALANRKNEVILRAVQEVLDFCEVLRNVPEFSAMLDKKLEDITQRLFSSRCAFTVEHEPIAVQYQAPLYRVDMHMPDHVSLSTADNAFLHISFNPVKFVVQNSPDEEHSTITQHLLLKQYRIEANGTFLHFQASDGTPADPIADILTELRAKLGHEFFEKNLLPYFENTHHQNTGKDA